MLPAMPDAAELWGAADYDRIAQRFAPVHDELVARLDPKPGERWLDVATGTGAVAARAVALGAHVSGIDIAPAMIEHARGVVPAAELEVGDAQALPYPDASFDVVSSVFGVIFAPDHEAVASELARVCRNRLGLTAWEPTPELADLYRSFGLELPEGGAPYEWGREPHVLGLLWDSFNVAIEHRVWTLEVESGEAAWELWSTAAPPFKAMVEALDEATREAFHAAYVAYGEQYREGDVVRIPRKYLLVIGTRR
jgi:SAM-dependent methyltransferase